MIRFLVNQNKTINLLSIFIIAIGLYYFIDIQKEGFPNIALETITISTPYPGASARDVDLLVTKKIIDAIDQVEGKKKINSISSEGNSIIIFEVDLDAGIKTTAVLDEIKNEVNRVKNFLPAKVEDSIINDLTFQNLNPVIQVVFYPNQANKDLVKRVSQEFETDISRFKGVGITKTVNNPDKQIWIELDQKKLETYDLDIEEVILAVRSAHFVIPGGKINIKNSEYLIKTSKQYQSLESVANTILRSNNDGKQIRIKDVARVKWAFKELEIQKRVAGQEAIILQIFQQVSGDVIKIGDQTKELIEKYSLLYPELNIFYYNDLSFYVKRRLSVLAKNATIGLGLVFICLLLFFDFKITFWTTLGIPFSFCLAMIAIYNQGTTLNLMSMFGLIIVIGMIVDDAIIVAENIYRRYEEGEKLFEAAIRGTQEVVSPIVAITATTMAAFLPLMTLPGLFGKILGIIPLVVSLTMLASFIECIFVLPGHLAHSKDTREEKRKKLATNTTLNQTAPSIYKRRWFQVVKRYYIRAVKQAVHRPLITLVLFISITSTGVYILVNRIPITFFPSSLSAIIIGIETSPNNRSEKTISIIDRVEEKITRTLKEEIKDHIVTPGLIIDLDGPSLQKDYTGSIQLNLDISKKLDEKKITTQLEQILEQESEVTYFEIIKRQGGPPPGNPVQIEFYSSDIDQLSQIGHEIKTFIESSIPNTTSVKQGLEKETARKEIVLEVDEERSSLLGINPIKIGNTIRSAFSGNISITANSMTGTEENTDILVKLNRQSFSDLAQVESLKVKNQRNRNIALADLIQIKILPGSAVIERKEGGIFNYVTAQLQDNFSQDYNSTTINQILKEEIPKWEKKHPGVTFELTGQKQEQEELIQGAIYAALLSIGGIFLILTSIFKSYLQPLIIMSILPFSCLGVLIGLFLTGHGIGLMPIIGMVALTGIVVNDSLVMVDFINRYRRQGIDKKEAIVLSAQNRLRPILMTTLTTIVGIGPLAYGIGGEEPFLEPMAVALFWGLSFTTLVLLFFLPVAYLIVDGVVAFLYQKILKKEYFQ